MAFEQNDVVLGEVVGEHQALGAADLLFYQVQLLDHLPEEVYLR